MTLAVGLVNAPTARAKHLPRLLLDAPALPKAIVRLLRALCQLPLPPLPGGSGSGGGGGGGDCFGFSADESSGAVGWGGTALPRSGEAVTLALSTLRDLIFERPTARAACLEVVLECTVHADESIRARGVIENTHSTDVESMNRARASV